MRIGIEAKVLTVRAGGIGRYAMQLVQALLAGSTATPAGVEFVLFTGPQTSRPFLSASAGMYREYGSTVQSSVWRALYTTPVGIVRQGIDVFHGLDHVGLPPFSKHSRYVVTIYDVIPLLFPHTFSLRHRLIVRAALARACQQADVVIVLSQATKADLLQHCRLPEDRVVVIPAACDARFSPAINHASLSRVRLKYSLPPLYMLFLGTLNPRKNVTTLLQAFAQFHHMQRRADPPVHLVIAGASGWRTSGVDRTLQRLDLESVVHFPGFLDEADLPDLYRGALLFVLPSLYEGFGFPVLEAMACGVPVVTSNVASLPEVAGDAAVLVDPCDVAGMAAALTEVVYDETLRHTLRCKGMAQAQKFSWDTAAKQTLDLYTALGD